MTSRASHLKPLIRKGQPALFSASSQSREFWLEADGEAPRGTKRQKNQSFLAAPLAKFSRSVPLRNAPSGTDSVRAARLLVTGVLFVTFLFVAPFVPAAEADSGSSSYGFGFLAFLLLTAWLVVVRLMAWFIGRASDLGGPNDPRIPQNKNGRGASSAEDTAQ